MTARIPARNISGCRRQLVDVAVFIPILLAALAVGAALLVANFWLANWAPSLVRGVLYIVSFASTPIVALFLWRRWALRSNAADVLLETRPEGVEFWRVAEESNSCFVRWNDIARLRSRSFAGATTIRLTLSIASTSPGWISEEYMLCADRVTARLLVDDIRSHVDRRPRIPRTP